MELGIILAFSLYFGVLFLIGLFWYAYNTSSSTMILGNRSINYWVTAIAAQSSDMSAWLFMGLPAAIYTSGLVGGWIAIGLIGGMFFSWHFIAPRLRNATEKLDTLTIPSFLEKRFNDSTGIVRIACSITTIYFFMFYIAAGLTGMGRVFETIFGMNYHLGMALGLGAALAYILLGGFVAIAWNDFFQGMFLLCMIFIVPLYALFHLSGLSPIINAATLRHIPLTFFPTNMYEHLPSIINGIVWGIGYLGMPHIIVNFMGIDKPQDITKAKLFGMSWLIISLGCALAIGIVGIGFFPAGLANPELVFVQLVDILFNPFLAGFILCAIIAATMTTIDTQILLSAATISEDLYHSVINTNASEKKRLWLFRLSIAGTGLIGYLLASPNSSTVMGLVSYAWAGLAATFSPIVLAALYDWKINSIGASAGIIISAIVSALWPLTGSVWLPIIPGFIVNVAMMYLVTTITEHNNSFAS